MTQTDLNILRTKLPRDWARKIAKELKLTPDQVRKVIRGNSSNPKVVASAIRLAVIEKETNKMLSEKIAAM